MDEKLDHIDKEDIPYTDFSTVETRRNFITAEDLPDGPYGSPRGENEPVHIVTSITNLNPFTKIYLGNILVHILPMMITMLTKNLLMMKATSPLKGLPFYFLSYKISTTKITIFIQIFS